MLAAAAALVVVVHDALADAGLLRRHAGADGGDDAAGLVAGDHRLGRRLMPVLASPGLKVAR